MIIYCEECGHQMEKVMFTEKEQRLTSAGYYYETGRERIACSHLECPECGHREVVDDTFDGPWRRVT